MVHWPLVDHMLESASRGGVCSWGGVCLVQGGWGVCLVWGVCSWGVCSRGVSAPGGGCLLLEGDVCSWRGVSAPGGAWSGGCLVQGGGACSRGECLVQGVGPALGGSAPGGIGHPSMHWGRHPPPLCGQTHACENIALTKLRCGQKKGKPPISFLRLLDTHFSHSTITGGHGVPFVRDLGLVLGQQTPQLYQQHTRGRAQCPRDDIPQRQSHLLCCRASKHSAELNQ